MDDVLVLCSSSSKYYNKNYIIFVKVSPLFSDRACRGIFVNQIFSHAHIEKTLQARCTQVFAKIPTIMLSIYKSNVVHLHSVIWEWISIRLSKVCTINNNRKVRDLYISPQSWYIFVFRSHLPPLSCPCMTNPSDNGVNQDLLSQLLRVDVLKFQYPPSVAANMRCSLLCNNIYNALHGEG